MVDNIEPSDEIKQKIDIFLNSCDTGDATTLHSLLLEGNLEIYQSYLYDAFFNAIKTGDKKIFKELWKLEAVQKMAASADNFAYRVLKERITQLEKKFQPALRSKLSSKQDLERIEAFKELEYSEAHLWNKYQYILESLENNASVQRAINQTEKEPLPIRVHHLIDPKRDLHVTSSGRELTAISPSAYFKLRKDHMQRKSVEQDAEGKFYTPIEYPELINPVFIDSNGKMITILSSKVLGEGSFGVVLLGIDIDTGKQVAIKAPLRVNSNLLKEMGNLNDLNRLVSVIKTKASNLFPYRYGDMILSVDEIAWGQEYYAALQEIDNEKNLNRMAQEFIREVMHLNETHIHRDVKNENMMWDKETKSARIIDFGLSIKKEEVEEKRTAGEKFDMAGSPIYMSPEAVRGQPCLESDVFACGISLIDIYFRRESGKLSDQEWMLIALKVAASSYPSSADQEVTRFFRKGLPSLFKDPIPPELAHLADLIPLIRRMIDVDIKARPSLQEVYAILQKINWKEEYDRFNDQILKTDDKFAVTKEMMENPLIRADLVKKCANDQFVDRIEPSSLYLLLVHAAKTKNSNLFLFVYEKFGFYDSKNIGFFNEISKIIKRDKLSREPHPLKHFIDEAKTLQISAYIELTILNQQSVISILTSDIMKNPFLRDMLVKQCIDDVSFAQKFDDVSLTLLMSYTNQSDLGKLEEVSSHLRFLEQYKESKGETEITFEIMENSYTRKFIIDNILTNPNLSQQLSLDNFNNIFAYVLDVDDVKIFNIILQNSRKNIRFNEDEIIFALLINANLYKKYFILESYLNDIKNNPSLLDKMIAQSVQFKVDKDFYELLDNLSLIDVYKSKIIELFKKSVTNTESTIIIDDSMIQDENIRSLIKETILSDSENLKRVSSNSFAALLKLVAEDDNGELFTNLLAPLIMQGEFSDKEILEVIVTCLEQNPDLEGNVLNSYLNTCLEYNSELAEEFVTEIAAKNSEARLAWISNNPILLALYQHKKTEMKSIYDLDQAQPEIFVTQEIIEDANQREIIIYELLTNSDYAKQINNESLFPMVQWSIQRGHDRLFEAVIHRFKETSSYAPKTLIDIMLSNTNTVSHLTVLENFIRIEQNNSDLMSYLAAQIVKGKDQKAEALISRFPNLQEAFDRFNTMSSKKSEYLSAINSKGPVSITSEMLEDKQISSFISRKCATRDGVEFLRRVTPETFSLLFEGSKSMNKRVIDNLLDYCIGPYANKEDPNYHLFNFLDAKSQKMILNRLSQNNKDFSEKRIEFAKTLANKNVDYTASFQAHPLVDNLYQSARLNAIFNQSITEQCEQKRLTHQKSLRSPSKLTWQKEEFYTLKQTVPSQQQVIEADKVISTIINSSAHTIFEKAQLAYLALEKVQNRIDHSESSSLYQVCEEMKKNIGTKFDLPKNLDQRMREDSLLTLVQVKARTDSSPPRLA